MNKYYEEHKNDYFEYDGKKYGIGTIFTTKGKYGESIKTIFNGQDFGGYDVIYKEDYNKRRFANISYEKLIGSIIEILDGNYYEELEKSKKYIPDSQVPEIVLGWIMYIAIMLGLVIFNQRWLGWIAATIYFFNWRRKKKEENSYYTKTDF